MPQEIVRLSHVKKDIDGSRVLRDVHLTLYHGEYHGVLIHNDISREVLVDILTGNQTADSGTFLLHDQQACLQGAVQAQAQGVYCIRTQSQLIPNLSIAENLFLTNGDYYQKGFMNRRLMRTMARDLLREAGLSDLDPDMPAFSLEAPQMHLVELLKTLNNSPKAVILDNIFHHYTQREFSVLAALMERRLPDCAVLFFSSQFNPLFQFAQRITVFRKTSTAITLEQRIPISHKMLLAYQSPTVAVTVHPPAESPKPSSQCLLETNDIAYTQGGSAVPISLLKHEILGLIDEEGRQMQIFSSRLAKTSKRQPSSPPVARGLCDTLLYSVASKKAAIIYPPGMSAIFRNLSLTENITLTMQGPIYNQIGLSNNPVKVYAAHEALLALDSEYLWLEHNGKKAFPHVTRSEEFVIQLARCICNHPEILILVNPHLHFDDLSVRMLPLLITAMREHIAGMILFSISRDAIASLCDRLLWLEK